MNDTFKAVFDQATEPTDELEETVETNDETSEEASTEAELEHLEEAETPTEGTGEKAQGMVPYGALKATREEVKSLKEALEALKQSALKQPETKVETPQYQAPRPHIPDPIDDPEGYAAYGTAQARQIALQTKLEISEALAVEKHGKETVEAAQKWAEERLKTDPSILNEGLATQLPYEWLIATHKRESLAQQILADPDAWAMQRAAELAALNGSDGAQNATTPVTQPMAAKAQAPRSIVHATSARKDVQQQSSAQAFTAFLRK